MGGGFTVRRWRARWCMHPTHLASPASARLGCSIFLKLSTGPHCGVPFPELGRLRGACGGSFGLRKQRGPRLRLPIYPDCPGSVCLGGGIFKVWCLTRWARWGLFNRILACRPALPGAEDFQGCASLQGLLRNNFDVEGGGLSLL